MRTADLFHATTFRLALGYLGIFMVSAVALLGLVSWTTSVFIDWQVQETVEAEAGGLSELYSEGGLVKLAGRVAERARDEPERRTVYLLQDAKGRALAGNLYGWPDAAPDAEGWVRFPIGQGGDLTVAAEVLGHAYDLPDGARLLVGHSLFDAKRVKMAINHALVWGLALTTLLGVIGGYIASHHLVARVEAMSRTARTILEGDMTSRMGLTGAHDEFDQLARSFNEMMDEIERLVEGIRTVTDNIAHDLRTPLNRLRSRIDVALLGESDPASLRAVLERTLAEADSLLVTFNALLTISQTEQGSRLHRFEPVDPARLILDVAELYEPLAEEKGVRLEARTEPGLIIAADRHLLFQALANLVDNAVKYSPGGGHVTVSAGITPDGVALTVADTGPGIPEEDRERVLDRFVRLDRQRSTPGNGLGLSLVRAVARLHRATLTLADNRPGLAVRLVFTRADEEGAPRRP